MVVRTRLRALVIPLALYVISGAVVSYFLWHGNHGERGLEAKIAFKSKLHALEAELADLQAERERWERRVSMMQVDGVDRDLLEEEARLQLGRIQKNELMIVLPSAKPAGS